MKKIIYLITLLMSLGLLSSKDLPFTYERLLVNFSGVVVNQQTVIAYGDGGIILRSTDKGEKWEQIKIVDDRYTIKRIRCKDGIFYGILNKDYLISSNDNGLTWSSQLINDYDLFIDFDFNDEYYFILTNQSVQICNYNFTLLNNFNLDSPNQASEIRVKGNYLYVPIDKGRISVFDLSNKFKKNNIDFKYLSLCDNCTSPTQLKVDSNDIYIQLNNYLLKSSDYGKTWRKLDSNVYLLNIYEKKYYSLSVINNINEGQSAINFSRSDSSGLKKISYFLLDRYIPKLSLTRFEFISNDTIIAVGKNKTIIISNDAGRSFECISNFNSVKIGLWVNNNLGYECTDNNIVTKTINGGITWLPQKYKPGIKNAIKGSYDAQYADNNGLVIFFKNNINQGGINFLFSDDFGENFFALSRNELNGYLPEQQFKPRIINKTDKILLFFNGIWDRGTYTIVQSMDNNLNFTSRAVIDSIVVLDARVTEDQIGIRVLGYERKYPNKSDSYDSVKYWVLYSYDDGKTWIKDFSFDIDNDWYSQCEYIDNEYIISSAHFDKKKMLWDFNSISILIPSTKKFYKKVFTDDSLSYFSKFYKFDNTVYSLGYKTIYFNNDIKHNPSNWQRDSCDKFELGSMIWNNDTIGYLGMGLNLDSYNIYKVRPIKTTKVEEIDILKTYLYNFPPYPNPSNSEVSFILYWDHMVDISTADISVFDIQGNKVAAKEEVSILRMQENIGIIKWNCSKVIGGIYFFRIIYGGRIQSVPIVVKR